MTVNLTNEANESPAFTNGATAAVNAPENGTGGVYAPSVTDADTNPADLTYSIVGGADASLFQINEGTGALSFADVPDFESPADADGDNAYEVVIRVSDGTNSNQQTVTVTVTDLDDTAPEFTSALLATAPENSTDPFYTAVVTDADSQNFTYSIAGGADGDGERRTLAVRIRRGRDVERIGVVLGRRRRRRRRELGRRIIDISDGDRYRLIRGSRAVRRANGHFIGVVSIRIGRRFEIGRRDE